jgi:SM-20-related protein
MTPKQILDSFSETLMQDERILSARERALIANLLQHVQSNAYVNPSTQEAVRAVVTSVVGETVAQRAFSVLGGSIVEQIVQTGLAANGNFTAPRTAEIHAGPNPGGSPNDQPQPPGNQPQPPGPHISLHKQPQPPGTQQPIEPQLPRPNSPSSVPAEAPPSPLQPQYQPQPPGHGTRTTVVSQTATAVLEKPATLPAKCVVLDEFLAPQELEELMRYTLEHEGDFCASEVVSPIAEGGVVNYEHRRSRVLLDLDQHRDVLVGRIRSVLPQVLDQLEMEEFSIADVETEVTASNDGDFFHFHNDNGSDPVASRHLTFVYFFHREPRQFEGGELRIHDARLEGNGYVSEDSFQKVVPQQNQIVFFPCELLHEITSVKCASGLFADSRFTLNGWLRR